MDKLVMSIATKLLSLSIFETMQIINVVVLFVKTNFDIFIHIIYEKVIMRIMLLTFMSFLNIHTFNLNIMQFMILQLITFVHIHTLEPGHRIING